MFLISFITWELVDFLLRQLVDYVMSLSPVQKALPSPARRTLLHNQAPAYIKSTLHATLVAVRGWVHLYVLYDAPRLSKLQIVRYTSEPYIYDESMAVIHTNIILAGYLMSDLIHVLLDFPALGGSDTVLHHLTFLACAIIAGYYKAMPFIFAWLIVGETSTPLLNLRWLLIKCDYTLGKPFAIVEKLFAGTFIFTRLFVYGAGLSHFFYILLAQDSSQLNFPMWALVLIAFFVVSGFALNLVWINKISMAVKRSRRIALEANSISNSNSLRQGQGYDDDANAIAATTTTNKDD